MPTDGGSSSIIGIRHPQLAGGSNSEARHYWTSALVPRVEQLDALPAHDGTGRLDTLCANLDEEIDAISYTLALVRARRNVLSLSYRLPPEILARCFGFLAHLDPPSGPYEQYLGWFKVTHVCAYWREIARSEPTLWANIDFCMGTSWVAETTSLAKATSLSVKASLAPTAATPIGSFLHKQRSRVKEINLCGAVEDLNATLVLTSRAPLSESLRLKSHRHLPFDSTNTLIMPSTLSADHSPHLRKLFLHGLGLP